MSDKMEFKKRYPKYQVRFWCPEFEYNQFKDKVKREELLISDVFREFMRWFCSDRGNFKDMKHENRQND